MKSGFFYTFGILIFVVLALISGNFHAAAAMIGIGCLVAALIKRIDEN